VTFIDEKSKYTWVTLLPSKDRVYDAFLKFQNYVTNQFDAKIKVLRSDNGGEYTSTKFKDHLSKHGIIHQTSCPYTPQQNGVAERKNRHLMEVARSMMFHMKVPKGYWGDAVMTACYLINRIPTKVLHDVSPYEVLNGTKPSINHLKVFGCACFVFIPGEQRNKLDAKSIKCIFLGYSITQKGYKCFDPRNNRSYVSRDVKFLEEQSYFEKGDWESLKNITNSTSDRAASLKFILNHLGQPNHTENQGNEHNNQDNPQEDVHDTQPEGEIEQNQAVTHQSDTRPSNSPETPVEESSMLLGDQ
jgi:transposase InsO family protein